MHRVTEALRFGSDDKEHMTQPDDKQGLPSLAFVDAEMLKNTMSLCMQNGDIPHPDCPTPGKWLVK